MFQLFRKKEWVPGVIDQLEGGTNSLRVVISNFPFRSEEQSGTRKFACTDFGNRFLTELTERALPKYELIVPMLSAGTSVAAHVQLADLPAIRVELSGVAPVSSRQFYSDLADTLIDAFKRENIKP